MIGSVNLWEIVIQKGIRFKYNESKRRLQIQQAFENARQLYRDGEFLKCERICNQILNVKPTHENALIFLATSCHKQQKYIQARKYYERCISSGIKDTQIFYNLGLIYAIQEEFGLALNFMEKVLRCDSNHPYIYHSIGTILWKGYNDVERARLYFMESLSKNSSEETLHSLLKIMRDHYPNDELLRILENIPLAFSIMQDIFVNWALLSIPLKIFVKREYPNIWAKLNVISANAKFIILRQSGYLKESVLLEVHEFLYYL